MKRYLLAAAGAFALLAGNAQAQVTFIGSQSAFSSAGNITQNTNFDGNGGGFTYPGDPFTVGALTFVQGGHNLIGGVDDYGLVRPLLTDNLIAGTTVNVAGAYNLFGFAAGNFSNQTGASAITVTTNLNTYAFTPTVAYGGDPLTFLGFQSTAGETISSVRFISSGALGGTDFQIGTAGSAVPEPATWAMMLLGFGMTGFGLRRRTGRVTTKVLFA